MNPRTSNLLVATALVVDGLLSALWVARLVPVVAAYDPLVLLLILARGLVSALLITAGSMLFRAAPPGPLFARSAVLTSALLLTLEIGFRLSPSSLFPSYRWPAVAGYWAYAGAIALSLRSRSSS